MHMLLMLQHDVCHAVSTKVMHVLQVKFVEWDASEAASFVVRGIQEIRSQSRAQNFTMLHFIEVFKGTLLICLRLSLSTCLGVVTVDMSVVVTCHPTGGSAASRSTFQGAHGQ